MSETELPDTELIEHLPFTTQDSVGTQARVGLIVLASDFTIEHEFRSLITTPGVDTFHARIAMDPQVTPETLAAMGPKITETCDLILGDEALDVVAYGCTSASIVLGEKAVEAAIHKSQPTAQVTTPITAAFAAFDALNAKKIAVLTPYRADVNEQVSAYIKKAGFQVPVFGSFNEEHDPTVARIDEASLKKGMKRVLRDHKVDAIFVSCTSVRLAHAVADLEKELGLPVTSSNHAMAWHVLRLAGVQDEFTGKGSLYTKGL